MTIKTNQELAQEIEKIIDDNGIKKIWLSERLGISNQNFNRLMSKKNSSRNMIYYNQVKGSKENKRRIAQAAKLFNPSDHHNKFSLTIDTFYYIHFFRKVNEKSQNEKFRNKRM